MTTHPHTRWQTKSPFHFTFMNMQVCVSVDLGEAWLRKSTSTCGSAEFELKLKVGGDQFCSTCFHSEALPNIMGHSINGKYQEPDSLAASFRNDTCSKPRAGRSLPFLLYQF